MEPPDAAAPAEPAKPAKPAVTDGEWAVIAQPDQLAFVRRQVAAFAALAGMQADDGMAELLVAVSEALTNAVVHAYRDRDSAGNVVVGAQVQPGELTIRVRDYGQGIAPRTDSPGMGIGLPMIARLAKVSSVRRCDGDGGGTEVSMSFPIVAVAHDARAELAAAHRT